MKTLFAYAVVLSAAVFVTPVSAQGLNTPSSGAPAAPSAAPGDLGMAIMSAAINADGSIARGEGVVLTGTTKLGVGVYEVAFGRDITACVYQVTVGESGIGGATPAAAGVTRRSGNDNGVFLQIDNAIDGTNVDRDFFVLVYCGR